MSNFEGYLIKFGNVIMPNKYLVLDGWQTTPNQRLEADAYRDANGLLHRETLPDYKTEIVLSVAELDLAEKIEFQRIINQAMLNETERKVDVTYWNDETNEYVHSSTGFYLPDIKWTITHVDEEDKDIIYKAFTVKLIEY